MNAVAYEDCARGATSGQYTTLVLMHQATLNAVAYEDCARGATSGNICVDAPSDVFMVQ